MYKTMPWVSGTSQASFRSIRAIATRARIEAAPENDVATLRHGFSESDLRALIAADLRAFVRRPFDVEFDGAAPNRPFLLDRFVGE